MKEKSHITHSNLGKDEFLQILSKNESLYNTFKEEINDELTRIDIKSFLEKTVEEQITKVMDASGFKQIPGTVLKIWS